MVMKKAAGLFIIAVMMLLTLSGCAQTEVKLELREDGSGSIYGKIAIQQIVFLMMSEALSGFSGEEASTDILTELQDTLRQSGAEVSGLEVYTEADAYVGFEFTAGIDEALMMELGGDEDNAVGLFEGFRLVKDDNGDNILSIKVTDYCDDVLADTMQGMYVKMSLDIDGELINSSGLTVDENGVVSLEQGNRDSVFTLDALIGEALIGDSESSENFNLNTPCDSVDIEASWKISDALYEKLVQFPSINSTASLMGNSWYGGGILEEGISDDFYEGVDLDHHPFTDIVGHPQESAIVYLWNNQVMHGTTPTTMNPDDFLSREQAVSLLYNAYGLDAGFAYEKALADVDKDHPAYSAIQWALNFDISAGTGVNSDGQTIFEPESILTREQVIVLLNNVLLYHDSYRKISEGMLDWFSLEISGPSLPVVYVV